jgi:hypothetical protein
MPPAYVKPYVKRQKNDAADAEAICEAVTRANMRFVATKTLEQQSCLMLHRTRHLFIRQQTAVINAIRAHLAEFGIVAPVGRNGVEQLLDVVADASDQRLPEIARACVLALGAQLRTRISSMLEFFRPVAGGTSMPMAPSASTRGLWMKPPPRMSHIYAATVPCGLTTRFISATALAASGTKLMTKAMAATSNWRSTNGSDCASPVRNVARLAAGVVLGPHCYF